MKMLLPVILNDDNAGAPGHEQLPPARGRFRELQKSLWRGCRLALAALLVQGFAALLPGAAAEAKPAGKPGFAGKVMETMDAGGYTYVQINTGKEKVWAAGPQVKVKVGDQVSFADGMLMQNHLSKTLNRTFERIYFVGSLTLPGQEKSSPNPHAAMGGDPHAGMKGFSGTGAGAAAVTDFSGLKKPAGGLTVAEVFARKSDLATKPVTLRGKVVKYNAQILGKNWLHVRDGTGAAGANDLTITTADAARVGDTVLVTGTVELNKDFGSGYKYDLLLEDAKVTVESKIKP